MELTPEQQKAAADAAEAQKNNPDYLRGEAKKAFEARDAAKVEAKQLADEVARLKGIEEEHTKLKQATMTEVEKTQARLKQLEPLEVEVKTYRESFDKMLAVETAALSEEHRALIPNLGTAAEKLIWVREAVSKGLFGTPIPPIGSKKPAGGGGNSIKRSELNALDLAKFAATTKKIKAGELVLVED